YSRSGDFFFQAEDGIRDFHVTGVQTCALPISRLKFEDADAIEAMLTMPALVGVESSSNGTLVSDRGITVENVWLTAASADLFRIRNMKVDQGRVFTAPEDRSGANVIVLGAEAADALFPSLNPIGRTVKVNNVPFRVIGVLAKQGALFGISLDNRAMAPARSAMGRMVNPHNVVDNILVRPDDFRDMDAAHAEVEATMRIRHRLRPGQDNDFAIETAEESLSFWDNIKQILMVACPVLVSISSVDCCFVIMSIMLVSVTARTREIGLRKALGARQRDIQLQMLVESATLSRAGAMLGIGIGLVLAQVVSAISPMPVALAPVWMAVSVALGVGVGVIAGIYPASRAAKLDPVVALRQE